MEKIKRIVAYTLVFVLVFGLFAGLGLYGGSQSNESMVKADTSSSGLVWEIVPNASVASASSVLTGYTVETYTPASLRTKLNTTPDSIDAVDLFIINQGGNTSGENSFFASSSTADNWLTWEEAFAIFKKISGANGDPAKFVIDATIYTGNNESSSDSQAFALANTPLAGTGGNNDLLPVTKSGTGFKNNATKLYTMLKIMDPGTFYGLYFATRGDSYGINENNGAILGYGFKKDGNSSVKESGYEVKSWSLDRLKPYFMMTSADQSLSTIGWKASSLSTTGYTAGDRGFAFTGSLSSVSSTISTLMANTGKTIDPKQYRFLVVEPNEKGSVDRRAAFKMAELAYSANESMVGGVLVDNVSMYNLASYIDNINDKYDCVYFGTTSDSNRTGSKEGISYTFRDKTYTKLGNSYALKIARYEGFSDVLDWVYSGQNTTSYYSGLDITAEAKAELEAFIEAGKPVYYSGILDSTKVDTDTKIYSLINTNKNETNVKSGSFLDGTELSTLKNSIKNRMSVVMIDKPVEYYAKIDFDYRSFNDQYDYGTKMRDPGVQYINEKNHSNRTMKFKFRVSGASSYKFNFYIDVNNDGRFEKNSTERKISAEDLNVSSSGVAKFAYTLGSSFTGAVNWKIEVYNASNSDQVFSDTGCCAVKNYGTPDTVNILQIIPVDQGDYSSVKNPAHGVPTNPTLLLPMKEEIRAAEVGKGALDVTGTIDGSKKTAIEGYFSGYLKIQTKDNSVDYTHAYAERAYQTINSSYASGCGELLVANAGLFYYFLKKENVCDLNVLRISVDELAARVALPDSDPYKIKIDGNTITYLNPDTRSEQVTCDLLMLGFCDYMLPQNSTVSSTSNTAKAIDAIANYISSNGSVFVGGGVLVPNENDYFTKKLMNACGLDRYGVSSGSSTSGVPGYTTFGSFYNTGNDAAAELMKTNKGTIVSYPYTIPDFTQGANAKVQTFQTNVDKVNSNDQNDISVFFCMTNIINSADNYVGFNARGDVVNNYYLFKKGNLTYSAVGFNELSASQMYGMKATVIKLPEAALLVNAIVASTSGDPHGHEEEEEEKGAPYTVPVDNPGSNELPVKPDVPYVPTVPSGSTVPADLKYDQHTVYVYPEYDGTKENVSDLISDNPSITNDGKFIFNFEVIIPDGCTSVTVDVFAGGTNLSIPVTATNGGTVTGGKTILKADSGKKFSVQIPIDSTYYTGKGLNTGATKYGMDLTDNFEVKIVTTPNFANPSTSSINGTITSVHMVKRGIFRIN